ncbi:pseudouridine synthase [Flavitalea sp.]|nr:pseudouridine synthase [Flavitalea sp.]
MARNSFDRFINKGATGSQKKEQIRQEKKQAREEKNAYFDQLKKEKKDQRVAQQAAPLRENQARTSEERAQKPGYSKPARGTSRPAASRSYGKSAGTGESYGSKKPVFKKTERSNEGKKAGYNKSEDNSRGYGAKKAGFNKPEESGSGYGSKRAGYSRSEDSNSGYAGKKASFNKSEDSKGYGEKKAAYKKPEEGSRGHAGKKTAYNKPFSSGSQDRSGKTSFEKAPVKKDERKGGYAGKPKTPKLSIALTGAAAKPALKNPDGSRVAPAAKQVVVPAKAEAYKDGVMPLNKFIAHAGVCSRRDAADLVKAGKVMVNGKEVLEPGFKVTIKDEVKVHGKQVVATRNFVYILLNKPKDFLTTTEDPEGRKTVMDIIKSATTERVYPIGRLDRNTTGVLLLTNDGELAQKLSHPSYEVKKIYEVRLDKPLQKKDFEKIIAGVQLEDGLVAPDVLAYADSTDKSIIGIEIHSGKNRIVRRIFEHVGYDVRNLDRVMYANLTKKNVERGKWRFLEEKEVRLLKFLNASYTKKPDLKPVR